MFFPPPPNVYFFHPPIGNGSRGVRCTLLMKSARDKRTPSLQPASSACRGGEYLCCGGGRFEQCSSSSSSGPSSHNARQSWRQRCSEPNPVARGKQCGERRFRELSNLARGEASPGEFPWTCLILDGENNFIGTCAIIPENKNNAIQGGTRKVITAAHKLANIQRNE